MHLSPCIVVYMNNDATNLKELVKRERRAERKIRAENDPWFGKRRRAGEMGRTKTKAEASRRACRGRIEV
ncbi:MAG: hypothetical protein E6Q97_12820 [Desulfurellales bacterium]|nr:MAG: hypothetical protein E6Q97_12820 [Desulfurellales bacterium]